MRVDFTWQISPRREPVPAPALAYKAALASPQGWPYILSKYAAV